MAQLIISSRATEFARAQAQHDEMSRPVLYVGWSKGQYDNTRGPQGEVRWTKIEEPHWFVVVSDWDEHANLDVWENCTTIDGLTVCLGPDARATDGKFVVDVKDDKLAVARDDA
jgi:hypothetical protein